MIGASICRVRRFRLFVAAPLLYIGKLGRAGKKPDCNQQTALNAFQEVSNALSARQKLDEVHAEQERAVRSLTDAVRFSTQRYVAGFANYFEVLEAQQQLYPRKMRSRKPSAINSCYRSALPCPRRWLQPG